ncbi:DHH family phosphoesterase [Peptoniphilus sp. BV3AC2]|uniref:DHH family phosphoesterase n=1 Tax=Peptoniphilus sp. BV3AC2 TaxID=1111133 RepID=UPI0003B91857|nr:DHH family phosphoesterase [Peptoniphilus sp. BV3AC2]ERT64493.1 DHHA1 domain protein [Peptoniphilus sp. BV3AC2]
MNDKYFNLDDFKLVILFSLVAIGVSFYFKPIVGGILFLVFLYILFVAYAKIKDKNDASKKYIEAISQDFDSITKKAIFNMPFPLVITDENGTILWYNSLYRNLFEEEVMGEDIKNLMPEIFVDSESEFVNFEMKFKDTDYMIFTNSSEVKSQENDRKSIKVFFMVDNSATAELEKIIKDTNPMVLKVEIDNYDEVMDATLQNERPILLAEIDSIIRNYFDELDGLIAKVDDETYVVVVSHFGFTQILDRKFDLLDDLRELKRGNSIPVTLSIGVSSPVRNLKEAYNEAETALDISLGRGGDQAVVKVDDSYEFFGGRSKAVEKRNKVKARVIGIALRQLIDATDDIFIMGHANPDMDAIGAAIGVLRAVTNRNKNGFIVLSESNPSIENLLTRLKEEAPELAKHIINHDTALAKINRHSLLIMVDNHRPSMTELPELTEMTDQIVVIDHHRRSKEFVEAPVLTYIEPYSSSTCELVTEILAYMSDSLNLSHFEADAIMSGIVVDTKNFTFQTGVRTFEAASILKRAGADMFRVQSLFKNDLDTLVSKAEVVHGTRIIHKNIAISRLDRDSENSVLIAAQAADELLGINGIEASFVLTHKNGKVHISGRSRGDFSVQLVLEKVGGGGHLNMAGAQIDTDNIDEAESILVDAVGKYLDEVEK